MKNMQISLGQVQNTIPPKKYPFFKHMVNYKNFTTSFDILLFIHQHLLEQTLYPHVLTNAVF